MGRGTGTETTIASARSESRSLRTTIPVFVVEQLGLAEGQKLTWKVDKVDGKWIAIFKENRG